MITRKRATSLIPVRIGALLVNSGALRPHEMQSALVAARQQGRRLGEVLLSQRLVCPEDLECALELQKLIKDGTITMETGAQALREAVDRRRPIRDILASVGRTAEKSIATNDLASSLLDAGCIAQAQLDQARWNAAKNGLPLGRNLVLSGAISPSTLGAALTALVLVREKKINIEQAVAALKNMDSRHCSLEEVLGLPALTSPSHVRVGELLSMAGLLSESDAMIAAESGLLNRRSIGQVLLEYRMVSPLVLDACLKLQAMIEQGVMSRSQGAEALRQVANQQIGLDEILSEMSALKSNVLELLFAAGLVTRDGLHRALQESQDSESDLLRALFSCGMLSHEMFRAAVRCVYAINEGTYAKQDAVAWLQYTFVNPTPQESHEEQLTA